MNLLITGGYGFIASNFINHYFHNSNINLLVNFDAMYYCANKENVKEEIRNSSKYIFIEGNLQNYDILKIKLDGKKYYCH